MNPYASSTLLPIFVFIISSNQRNGGSSISITHYGPREFPVIPNGRIVIQNKWQCQGICRYLGYTANIDSSGNQYLIDKTQFEKLGG